MLVCLYGCAYLYGSTPVSVIRRVLERELGEDMSEERILSLYDSLPSDSKYSSYDAATGRINYRRLSEEELAELVQKQEGKDFYIPSLAEINEIYEWGFSSASPAYAHYRKFLENYCDIDPDDAKDAAAELSKAISEENAPEERLQEMIAWSGADSSCARNCFCGCTVTVTTRRVFLPFADIRRWKSASRRPIRRMRSLIWSLTTP